MHATSLSSSIWNSIAETLDRGQAPREITFGRVVKRDTAKNLIWLQEFGNLAIPLVAFGFRFEYYDTNQAGTVTKKADPTGLNDALNVKIIVPRVGQVAVVLDPGGKKRFPLCVGVIQSNDFWRGEEF